MTFHSTVGAVELGVLVSTLLYGVFLAQWYSLYDRYPNDKLFLKAVVFAVAILELAHTVCDWHALYTMTVLEFDSPEKILALPQSINVGFALSGAIGTLVQGFYALRIKSLTGKPYIPYFCWAASLAIFVLSIISAVQAITAKNEIAYQEHSGLVGNVALILLTLTDVVITAYLCWHLRRQRGGALRSTTKLLDSLILWTVQTGLLTSISAILTLVLSSVLADNFIGLAVFICMPKLYSNSLLALLNSRERLRDLSAGSAIDLSTGISGIDVGSRSENNRRSHAITFNRPHLNGTEHSATRESVYLQDSFSKRMSSGELAQEAAK